MQSGGTGTFARKLSKFGNKLNDKLSVHYINCWFQKPKGRQIESAARSTERMTSRDINEQWATACGQHVMEYLLWTLAAVTLSAGTGKFLAWRFRLSPIKASEASAMLLRCWKLRQSIFLFVVYISRSICVLFCSHLKSCGKKIKTWLESRLRRRS